MWSMRWRKTNINWYWSSESDSNEKSSQNQHKDLRGKTLPRCAAMWANHAPSSPIRNVCRQSRYPTNSQGYGPRFCPSGRISGAVDIDACELAESNTEGVLALEAEDSKFHLTGE